MMATLTIADFLLARIGEDEAEAWRHFPQKWGDAEWEQGHIDRVLDTCKAHRAIVSDHWAILGDECARCGRDAPENHGDPWPCSTLRALSSVYADHADFDPAWS